MSALTIWLLAQQSIGAAAAGAAERGDSYYGPHMWHSGWPSWFFGPIMLIVFIAVIAALVMLLVRWLGATGHGVVHHHPPARVPLDILKERFARGEIDKAEFEERRHVLGD